MKKFTLFLFVLLLPLCSFASEKNFINSYLQISRNDILNQHQIPVLKFKVIKVYPHSEKNFTEGLVLTKKFLYEGTGLYGKSRLIKSNRENTKIIKSTKLNEKYFGEGITVLGSKIYQLSLKSNTGFVYNRKNQKLEKTFIYPTQGWGLTNDGHYLIMSDGSSALHFLDPTSLKEVKHIFVHTNKQKIGYLNALNYYHGSIYVNVWQSDLIAKISPKNGKIEAWIDLTGLNPNPTKLKYPYVLNGLAWNPDRNTLLVTGKCWPKIYEIKLVK